MIVTARTAVTAAGLVGQRLRGPDTEPAHHADGDDGYGERGEREQDRPAAVDAEGENAAHHEDDGRADEAGPGDPVGQHERGLGFPGLGGSNTEPPVSGEFAGDTENSDGAPHRGTHERQNGCDDRQDTHGQPFYDFASLPSQSPPATTDAIEDCDGPRFTLVG